MSLLDESLAISTELDMRPFDGAGSVVKGGGKVDHVDELAADLWTDFGAFVDVGVHQDGLVHMSTLGDYVRPSVKGKCPPSRLPC